MKKVIALTAILLVTLFATNTFANNPGGDCTAIKDGTLVDANGNPISTGYDVYGYNYQAHMFNGFYDNYARPDVPFEEGDTWLQMKWSDEWLSKFDCDGDTKLDRGLGTETPGTSQGWLTNHEEGTYENLGGEMCEYTYFVKIVYMPEACNADNKIWGSYCIIQENLNDPCGELGWSVAEKIVNPGLGLYTK